MATTLGLDIGTHAIKLIELSKDRNAINLIAAGTARTPTNALTSSNPADAAGVAEAIKKLIKE